MAEELFIPSTQTKTEKYEALLPQIKELISGEKNLTANLANISAALKQTFNWWWVGFYWVENKELVLGPFQGPIACTRIPKGRGVCGTSWLNQQTIVVPDVEKFQGHIACSSFSKSEIVIPIFKNNNVVGVLDCDSEYLNHFDETDKIFLEQLSLTIAATL